MVLVYSESEHSDKRSDVTGDATNSECDTCQVRLCISSRFICFRMYNFLTFLQNNGIEPLYHSVQEGRSTISLKKCQQHGYKPCQKQTT